MRHLHHRLRRCDGAERVRNLREGDELGPAVEELAVLFQQHLAVVIDRHDAQLRALGERKLLPRHDVGVMLEMRDDDLVARTHVLQAERVRHEVDGLGGAAHEHDLLRRRRIDEARHLVAGSLVGIRRTGSQLVRRTVDVGVFVLIEVRQAIDDRFRLLRRGRVVEPDQRPAVHGLRQDRKIPPDGVDVERRMRRLEARRSGRRLGRRTRHADPCRNRGSDVLQEIEGRTLVGLREATRFARDRSEQRLELGFERQRHDRASADRGPRMRHARRHGCGSSCRRSACNRSSRPRHPERRLHGERRSRRRTRCSGRMRNRTRSLGDEHGIGCAQLRRSRARGLRLRAPEEALRRARLTPRSGREDLVGEPRQKRGVRQPKSLRTESDASQ